MFYDRVKYTIEHNNFESEILEPIKWKEDTKRFERHNEYHGIATILSGELTFTGNARDFLIGALDTDGVNAEVSLTREIKNSKTDLWEKDYVGWADFLSYKIDDKKFSIKFNADPTITLFKSKLSTKIELERLTTLTGEPLSELDIKGLYIEGRDILLTSKLESDPNYVPFLILQSWNNNKFIKPFALNETGDQNTGILDVTSQLVYELREFNGKGEADEWFLGLNNTGQTMNYNVDITLNQSWYMVGSSSDLNVRIVISVFSGLAQTWVRDHILWEYDGESSSMPKDIKETFPTVRLVMANEESASIQYHITASNDKFQLYHRTFSQNIVTGLWTPYYIDNDGKFATPFYNMAVSVYEDSTREPSTSNSIRVFEFAKRLNDIVLEAEFKSDTLGRADMDDYSEDGYLSDLTLLHGMWLRGMSKGVDRYKPISTSLQDMLSALNVISPIGVAVGDGKFRIEDRDYFYQKFVTIKLGDVTDLIIEPASKDYVSTITVGYEKAGGYEENSGLDEYNRETDYNTILKITPNELKLLSKYRADSYGLETIRRENPEVGLAADLSENQDSKFDDHIWFVDTNEIAGASNLEVSGWAKRFSEEPTGAYSVETAFNIWLSPINILLRHGPWLKAPLLKYLDSIIAFNYSEGNSALTTKLISGNRYSQNVGIPVKDLERSANKAQEANFSAPVTWEQLNGTSFEIPNVYGLVEAYYKGERVRGHIMSVSLQNGIGEFKLKLYS